MFTDISLCTFHPARNLSLFSEAPSCECELREKGGCSFTGTEPLERSYFTLGRKRIFIQADKHDLYSDIQPQLACRRFEANLQLGQRRFATIPSQSG